jgi:hypothetical protein
MVRLQLLMVQACSLVEVQALACIGVAPLAVVGCILAFVACKPASWVEVGAFVEACIQASLVVVACTLEAPACMRALVVVV